MELDATLSLDEPVLIRKPCNKTLGELLSLLPPLSLVVL